MMILYKTFSITAIFTCYSSLLLHIKVFNMYKVIVHMVWFFLCALSRAGAFVRPAGYT